MQYDTYLKEGYPITTGVIESACGHFVKSKMKSIAMHCIGVKKGLKIC